jgi:hypothetical protein
MNEWLHSGLEIIGVASPILFFMWRNRREAKRDTERRHEENQREFRAVIEQQKYLPPHDHIETGGPLQASGIVRKKVTA